MRASRQPTLTTPQITTLMVSVFIIAICGLVYELIIGTMSAYLLGNAVAQFSLTIGLFLCAMGVGSLLSRNIKQDVLHWFVVIEITIGVVGGSAAAILYAVFATTDLYYPATAVLIFAIGICIGLEIPLLTRLSKGYATLKDTLANVLAFDYLGALIGSILFPIFLLPELGILRTSFIIGLLNLVVAGVILATFWSHLSQRRLLATGIGVGVVMLLAGTIWSFQLIRVFEQRLYTDAIIYTEQTPYQRIIMTRWGEDVRLYLDGNIQFSLADEYRYHEPLVHPAVTLSAWREEVLVLGGGDGIAVRELLKYDEIKRIVLVDLDPAVTRLAREHPALVAANEDALSDPRVEVIHADAYTYLAETSDLFGVIIADLPDPNNESLSKLYSTAFYKLVDRHLAVGGVFITQSTSPYFARDAFWSIATTIETHLPYIQPYRVYVPSFGEWGFIMAANRPLAVDVFVPQVETQWLTAEQFDRSRQFDSDTERPSTPLEPSTLDNPAVLRYYEQGWREWR